MPKTIKLEDGTEEEVFTADDVAAKAKEEADAIAARAEEDKQAALAEKEDELAKTREELEKFQKKDYNFEQTRKGKNKAEAKEEDLASKVSQLSDELAQFKKIPIEDAKNDFVSQHIGNNKDLKDKFDVFWGKLGADVKTKAEAEAAMTQAFMLASDGKKPDTSRRMAAASVDDDFAGTNEKAESEISKEISESLGVSEEDKKKYGPKAKVNLMKHNIKAKG